VRQIYYYPVTWGIGGAVPGGNLAGNKSSLAIEIVIIGFRQNEDGNLQTLG
jgi:hypothetical protein